MDLSTEDIGTIQTTVSLDQFSTIENNQTFTSISSEGPGKLNFTDVYVSTVYPNEEDTNCFERFITSWQGIVSIICFSVAGLLFVIESIIFMFRLSNVCATFLLPCGILFFVPGCVIGFLVVYGSQCPDEKLEGAVGYAVLGAIGFVLALLLLIGRMTNCGRENGETEDISYSSSLDETIGEDGPADP